MLGYTRTEGNWRFWRPKTILKNQLVLRRYEVTAEATSCWLWRRWEDGFPPPPPPLHPQGGNKIPGEAAGSERLWFMSERGQRVCPLAHTHTHWDFSRLIMTRGGVDTFQRWARVLFSFSSTCQRQQTVRFPVTHTVPNVLLQNRKYCICVLFLLPSKAQKYMWKV